MPPTFKVPPPEEAEVPFRGPALMANRFYITVGPTVRIAFAEQEAMGKVPHFRSAVALSHADASELSNVLKAVLQEAENQRNEAKKRAEEARTQAAPGVVQENG